MHDKQSAGSYILAETKEYKTRFRRILRIAAFVLLTVIMMKTLLGAGVWWHTILKQWNDQHMDDTQLAVWTTFAVVQGLIFVASITLPDVMMILVARIYFTECYLYAKSFVNEVIDMNMDEIIDGHILERYLEMNKKIEGYKKLFYLLRELSSLFNCSQL